MLSVLDTVDKIQYVGPKFKKLLSKLNIFTIQDLLLYFPKNHTDTSVISKISELSSFESKTVKAKITSIRNIRAKNKMILTTARVSDDSGSIQAIWFNQPFLVESIKENSQLLIRGKLKKFRNTWILNSPEFENSNIKNSAHLGLIRPEYDLTAGISNKWIRRILKSLLENHPYLVKQIKDSIPKKVRLHYKLIAKPIAIKYIHFPKNEEELKNAKRALAFEELYEIQAKLLKKKRERLLSKSPEIKVDFNEIENFKRMLKFKLTRSQEKVISEVLNDYKKPFAQDRLIQGDVGSGKTVVAATACFAAVKSGFQAAFVAPTAILAEQHYLTLSTLFKKFNFKIAIATSEKETNFKNADIIIGTHALFFRKEKLFFNLGLVVVDEQHRFGVEQRRTLQVLNCKKKLTIHRITMTATPIPRSIALVLFKHLDLSIIDELPKGRKPVKTFLVPHEKRESSILWAIKKIKTGSKIFWICPLISESEKIQASAVETIFKELKSKMKGFKIGLLHGKMSEAEKNELIKKMNNSKLDVLVSTSVIEVGMDIKNADIIFIEDAERFGLAQLHQLRGRVGRSEGIEGFCFLFYGATASSTAIRRLNYFAKENNGLKVSEYDLKMRGPGEVYSTMQSGIPNLKVASLDDFQLIKETAEAVKFYFNS